MCTYIYFNVVWISFCFLWFLSFLKKKKVGYTLHGHCGEPYGRNGTSNRIRKYLYDDQKNSRGFVKFNDRYARSYYYYFFETISHSALFVHANRLQYTSINQITRMRLQFIYCPFFSLYPSKSRPAPFLRLSARAHTYYVFEPYRYIIHFYSQSCTRLLLFTAVLNATVLKCLKLLRLVCTMKSVLIII